jgi:hypothetical protein
MSNESKWRKRILEGAVEGCTVEGGTVEGYTVEGYTVEGCTVEDILWMVTYANEGTCHTKLLPPCLIIQSCSGGMVRGGREEGERGGGREEGGRGGGSAERAEGGVVMAGGEGRGGRR